MSNPNKSYFDKYTDPVVREIDKVNIYEFENGMDYELTISGKPINVDTIKEAQNKVLKNLKKDPTFYTNMLVNETIKMVGEYGSGKKPGVRSTAKSAESVKKDGKMPKASKQDAPFGGKDEVKGKYKSSGMEPAKKVPGSLNESKQIKESFQSLEKKLEKGGKSHKAAAKIAGKVANLKRMGHGSGPTAKQKARFNEGLDVHTLNPASLLHAIDNNPDLIKRVKQAIHNDVAKQNIVVRKIKDYIDGNSRLDDKEKAKLKKLQSNLRDSGSIRESKGIPTEQLKKLKQLVSKLKEEGKKDLASALERLLNKGVDEGMSYVDSNYSTSVDPAYYGHATMKSMESLNMKEDVDVKDSRTIRLTPTTKNQILTLVHEMAKQVKEGAAVTTPGGVTLGGYRSDVEAQKAAQTLRNQTGDSVQVVNTQTGKKTSI